MNKQKIKLLLLGGFWGYFLTVLFMSVGKEAEATTIDWLDFINLLFIFGAVSFVAIQTYLVIKE